MNIQDEIQKIHKKFGVSEMANYKIEQFVEDLIKKDRAEQLILHSVSKNKPLPPKPPKDREVHLSGKSRKKQ